VEALIPSLVAAGLVEAGGRMQRLAAALSRRFDAKGAVIAGFSLAAAVSMGIGAALGAALAREVPHSAARLLVGVALVFAGIGGLFRPKPAPDLSGWRLGTFLSSAGAALILGFGEAAQFVCAALSAASGAPVATAIGATLGVALAGVPPVLLAERWEALPGLAPVRVAAAALAVLAGATVALLALEIA
jgi:putative Ca2+/H+ antiporter (TMEM165/GDT1 family)